jgi:hypothetical protein
MTGRWRNRSGFRVDPDAAPASRPSRRQTIALLAVLALVAGAVAVVSYLIRPEQARAFDLFHGSMFLSDQNSPVAVDLTSGKATLRLHGADQQVGLTTDDDEQLAVVPLTDDTLLLNPATGEFNMVDNSGFVVKHDGGGVTLDPRKGASSSTAVAAGNGQAYIVRSGSPGGTDVYLVNQSTVESATGASGKPRPRASGSMQEEGSEAVSANGALWLFAAQSGTEQRIVEFTVPPGSSTGATLIRSDHGQVTGPAAIGKAPAGVGSADVVGVASLSGIQLFGRGAPRQRVGYQPPPDVTRIVPATTTMGRLAFLLDGSNGWYLTSVNTDGTDLQVPRLIGGLPKDANLAEPAASNGWLYTLNKNNGNLYRIGFDAIAQPVPGQPSYPARHIEFPDFSNAYVTARGPRVVFNSPTHDDALMVFTDGSRGPRTIVKSAAISVDASGGAEALTKSSVPPARPGKKTGGKAKPVPNPVQQVNTKIDCKTVKQKPHIPVINTPDPGSRTVALSWNYQVISQEDCFPSTYVVSLDLLTTDAPPPPGRVTVRGQTGTTISGLFPDSRYQATVTAYINGEHTASLPVDFPTGPEGPAAPTDLAVSADSAGNWKLHWDSCGTIAQGCVAAQSWTITPSFCDRRGVSSPPRPMTVTADPTSKRQPPAVYPGRDTLLGRGMQFQVLGNGAQGQAGTPSARSGCIYSWAPPVSSALSLRASAPQTRLGHPTKGTVVLDLGSDPVRNVGGVGAQVTLALSGPDGRQSKTLTFDGQTAMSARFGGVQAGTNYTASARVRPGRGGRSVSIGPVAVTTRAHWPAMSLSPSCPQINIISCELTVRIKGLTSAQANNEKFDFNGLLQCGSTGFNFSATSFDPADPIDAGPVSQLNKFFGGCAVSGQLQESPNSPQPEVFGGAVKPLGPTPFDLGAPSRSGAGQKDFTADWNNSGSDVVITYNGNADLRTLTQDWSETVIAPDDQICGSGNDVPDKTATVHVDVLCENQNPGNGWQVSISYHDSVDGAAEGPFTYSLGAPSGFAFCTPTSFSASASGDTSAPKVDVAKPDGDLSGCSRWSYDLLDQNNKSCLAPGGGGGGAAPPVTLDVDPNCDLTGGLTLSISWVDPARVDHSRDVPVSGNWPTPSPSPSSSPT